MKISYLLQCVAFPVALALPVALIVAGWQWQAAAVLTGWPLAVGLLAAAWDYFMWRREI